MPTATRALTRAARERAAAKGIPYTQARQQLLWIQELVDEGEFETREEADEYVSDSRHEVLCETCGWTNGMVCPECPGCGCYNTVCSGWRHDEYMSDDERRELAECSDCGGDVNNHYDCRCNED